MANKNKATHSGQCQLCGNLQKLPGGFLAKHGYSVEWSRFVGVCPGSHHLPYEKACDLIQGRFNAMMAEAINLEVEAAIHERDAAGLPFVMVHEYVPATWERRRAEYVWRRIAREDIINHNGYDISWRDLRGRLSRHSLSLAGAYAAYVEHLRHEAAEIRRYAGWLEERLLNWKERDLIPVSE